MQFIATYNNTEIKLKQLVYEPTDIFIKRINVFIELLKTYDIDTSQMLSFAYGNKLRLNVVYNDDIEKELEQELENK